MRKIVSGLFMSLDGVVESPDQWHFPYWSDEMGQAVQSQMDASDTMLLGRKTYQEFAGFWPTASSDEMPMADFMNNTPKLVVSNTLDAVEWQNSTLVSGNVNEQLAEVKQQPGKDISIVGSGTLVRSLLRDNLLDELQLLVHPIAVGGGRKRLFDDWSEPKGLKLVDSRAFSTGVLLLTYAPADS